MQVGGVRRNGTGIVRQNGYRLASTVTYVCDAAHFSHSASTLKSANNPNFEFWQRVIKKRQENVIHANLTGVSRQVDRM